MSAYLMMGHDAYYTKGYAGYRWACVGEYSIWYRWIGIKWHMRHAIRSQGLYGHLPVR